MVDKSEEIVLDLIKKHKEYKIVGGFIQIYTKPKGGYLIPISTELIKKLND